jgi:hypothetical protein
MWWALIITLAMNQCAWTAWCEIPRVLPPIPVPEWEYRNDAHLKAWEININREFYRNIFRVVIILLWLLGDVFMADCQKYYVWWSV